MTSSLFSPTAVNHHYFHRNSSILTASGPYIPSIRFLSSKNWRRNCNLWRGRCGATSPTPPESEPPSGDEHDSNSGSMVSVARLQESAQIFFAVLFWMSLFFWSSVWDGRNNGRSDKGPRFWK
uniref:uncharacterized protein LOC122589345 n=1 Tax=Erigeron canadensis TaxID=72917 RepID=UPI001CB93E62|nr:uncharacterized protein LOC122589345 [Erigeron canadensis]